MLASTQTAWFVIRATGLMSLVLLSASVVLGVVAAVGWSNVNWPRFVTLGLHRNISLLGVVLLAGHIAITVLDGFAPIGWLDAVVPLRSAYRSLWMGFGALSLDLLLVVVATSLVRRYMSHRSWRIVHWSAWAAWPAAVLHGLGTGSDTKNGWAELVYVACAAAVLSACWWRIAVGWPARLRLRVAALVASVVIPLLVFAWTVRGPLQQGWARRAGSPTQSGQTQGARTGSG